MISSRMFPFDESLWLEVIRMRELDANGLNGGDVQPITFTLKGCAFLDGPVP